jgi:hypothetical protein
MNAREFIERVRRHVVAGNLESYRTLFETTNIHHVTDPYWEAALGLFRDLDGDQQEILFSIMRQVTVDALASAFAVIDGIAVVDGADMECSMIVDGAELSGDLQEALLAAEEDECQ